MPYPMTKIIGVSDASAIMPKPSIRGSRPRIEVASPTPRAVTSGTVTVDAARVNQTAYQRDHVWPGDLIRTMGRMAAGDEAMTRLDNHEYGYCEACAKEAIAFLSRQQR